ncbi:MAG: beta-galactosidase [Solirubrobacterales bacterium]
MRHAFGKLYFTTSSSLHVYPSQRLNSPDNRQLLVIGALFAFFALAHPSVASARTPEGFFGISAPHMSASTLDQQSRTLAVTRNSGVETVELVFNWADIEPRAGEYWFDKMDGAVAAAAQNGLAINAAILGAPAWASSAPANAQGGFYPPKRVGDFARFAAKLVERYGPNGEYWSTFDRWSDPYTVKPIKVWRIWNEPSLPVWWRPRPNARAYVRLLAAARRSILRVDSSAKVLTAGIPDSKLGVPMDRFIRGMYRAGGARVIDNLALNPYAANYKGILGALRRTRITQKRYRDLSAKIWITEFGWADSGPPGAFTTTSRGQARRIRDAVRMLVGVRVRFNIAGVNYFAMRDQEPTPNSDFWGRHTGLFRLDGRAKQAWSTYYTEARRARGVRGSKPPNRLPSIGD